MIVVDTNVIAYLFLSGTHSALARQLYLKDSDWCAPVLWKSELRNVLMLYLKKQQMSLDETIAVAEEAEELMVAGEYQVASESVLRLVAESGHSAYDCEFVALAQKLETKLVTSDKKLIRAFPKTAISLSEYVKG